MDFVSLLAQVPSGSSNVDAWNQTLTLLFGGSGVVTVLASAVGYAWKKNADRRFEAEQDNRRIMQELQKDATQAQKELVEHLKSEVQTGRKLSRTNTRAVQALTKSSDKNTAVLQQIADHQEDHLRETKEMHGDLSKAVANPTQHCNYKKETTAPVGT